MFGLTLSKLVLIAVVIFVIWYGFRLMNRMGQAGAERARERLKEAVRTPPDSVADMQRCPACGDFVVPNLASACGKDLCPYGRRS